MRHFNGTKQMDSIKQKDYSEKGDFLSSLYDQPYILNLLLRFHFIFMLILAFLIQVKLKMFSYIFEAKLLHWVFTNAQIFLSTKFYQKLYY